MSANGMRTASRGFSGSLVPAAVAAAWVALGLAGGSARAGDWDAGPFGAADRGLLGEDRLRLAGPLFESRHDAESGASFLALRPLFSTRDDPERGERAGEALWPVGAWRRTAAGESDWRFLIAFGHDFDVNDPDSRRRFWLLPFVFSGRDVHGESYFALFPLGGHIHEFLGQDRITFWLFPLYGASAMRDVRSHTVLWPIIAWAEGDEVSRLRVFPFYGRSESRGRWTRRFVLWPIWTSVSYDYPDSGGGGFVLFPLFGHHQLENGAESWMVLPPLFRRTRTAAGETDLVCPWPFVRYSSGPIEKLYLWPLWGRKHDGPVRSAFFLWPLGHTETITRRDTTIRRDMLLPFYYAERRDRAPAGEAAAGGSSAIERYVKLWPLFSHRRTPDAARFSVPELWPLKNTPAIERNWSPLWTLYSRRRVGGVFEEEILWGLWRRQSDETGGRRVSLFPFFAAETRPITGGSGAARRWSALGGLLERRSEGLRTRWRVCYVLRLGRETRPVTDSNPDGR